MSNEKTYRDMAMAEARTAIQAGHLALDADAKAKDAFTASARHAELLSALWTLCAEVSSSNDGLEAILHHLRENKSETT
jgi:hypothetical protein